MVPEALFPTNTLRPGAAPIRRFATFFSAGALAALFVCSLTSLAPTTAYSTGRNTASEMIMLCRAGHPGLAVRIADQTLERGQHSPSYTGWIHYLRGGALRVMGYPEAAQADYQAAARILAPNMSAIPRLAMESDAGNSVTAEEIAEGLLRAQPNDSISVNDACWSLAMYDGGNTRLALDKIRPLGEKTHDPGVIDTYAWCLYREGHRSQAVQQERRALELAELSGSYHLYYYAACLAGMEGNTTQAASRLRALFARDITFTSAWAAAHCLSETPAYQTFH